MGKIAIPGGLLHCVAVMPQSWTHESQLFSPTQEGNKHSKGRKQDFSQRLFRFLKMAILCQHLYFPGSEIDLGCEMEFGACSSKINWGEKC